MSKKHSPETGVSRLKVKRRVGLIALLFLITGSLTYSQPTNWVIDKANGVLGTEFGHINLPFVLGLDLQGGTHLEYEADLSMVPNTEQASALDGVRDVIERRVNAMGVSEPLVQTTRAGDNYRVSVELAGVRDINEAINMIGETPILEFKVINDDPPRQLTEEEIIELDQSENQANEKAQLFLADVVNNPDNFQDKVKEVSEDPDVKANGGDLGFIKDKSEYAKIYEVARDAEVGKVVSSVISTDNTEVVAKVEEKTESGKEVKARHLLIQWDGAMQAGASTTRSKEDALAYVQEIKNEVTPENFADKVKELSEEPGAEISGGDLGWFATGVMVESFEEAVFPQKVGTISEPVQSDFGYHLIYKEDERSIEDVRVSAIQFSKLTRDDIIPPAEPFKRTELTGKQLERAQLEFNPNSGAAEVGLQFNDEGADLFAEITKENIGKPVAIYLDGEPISVPTVNSEILGGRAVITGTFSVAEAKLLAQRLQAGALPVPIELIAQQSVGPSLGKTSVNASLIAGMWGFLLVALFMIIVYRVPGIIAVLSLSIYATLVFAVFKSIPVTLTLSGIAGLILSVGMAVDANVLIFERLKEELKLKKSYSVALEEAFRRAWPSIRDGNLTTLISCVVLYWFSSSIIKGFALTLGIGVVLSMFTAIVITRNLMHIVALPKFVNTAGWFFLKKSDPNKDASNDK
ncbi:MAG: protein translocase subunit SecD [Patescibacteria group bacterium]|nr:protein translocase subunit SecD [Patescibacteria group bacterium]